MDKNEILEKSRKENRDEGVAYAEQTGRRYGEVVFCLLIILVLLYNIVKGLDNSLPMSLLWGYLAAAALGRYQSRRGRYALVTLVCSAIASLCFLLCYVLRTW